MILQSLEAVRITNLNYFLAGRRVQLRCFSPNMFCIFVSSVQGKNNIKLYQMFCFDILCFLKATFSRTYYFVFTAEAVGREAAGDAAKRYIDSSSKSD